MKVPANITADRLMLEYLARVAAAGTRYLPKGDRIAFVSKTRRRIERECGPGLGDADCMRDVLARLGEPEELVKTERTRLDAARVRRRAPDEETGAAAAESITAPLEHRRINSRWRPATHARPGSQPQPGLGDTRPDGGPPESGRRPAREGMMRGRLAALLGEWPGARWGPRARSEPAAGPPGQSGPAGPDATSAASQTADGAASRADETAEAQADGSAASQTAEGPAAEAAASAVGEGAAAQAATGTGAGVAEPAAASATSVPDAADPAIDARPVEDFVAGAPVPDATPAGDTAPMGTAPIEDTSPDDTAALAEDPVPGAPPADWGTPAAPDEPLEGKVLPPVHAEADGAGGPPGAGTRPQAATPPPGWSAPVPVSPRPLARRERGTTMTAMSTVGHATAQLAWSGAAAARRSPREATAIILLGVGGLILPFPFWLIGATVAIWSRIWDPLDKWVAFLGPLAFALVGSIVTAAVIHAEGNVVLIYSHAVRVDIGYLLRIGSVLCAVFLAVRMRHGPRERVPPWRR